LPYLDVAKWICSAKVSGGRDSELHCGPGCRQFSPEIVPRRIIVYFFLTIRTQAF